MHRSRHSRLPTSLRVFVLMVFVLGLVMQPVLASFGEMHELAHDPSGMHSHSEHSDDVAAELAATEQDEEGAATLHLLLHFAHCCGQSAAATLPSMRIAAVMPAVQPTMTQAQVASQTRLFAPFRPPITA